MCGVFSLVVYTPCLVCTNYVVIVYFCKSLVTTRFVIVTFLYKVDCCNSQILLQLHRVTRIIRKRGAYYTRTRNGIITYCNIRNAHHVTYGKCFKSVRLPT